MEATINRSLMPLEQAQDITKRSEQPSMELDRFVTSLAERINGEDNAARIARKAKIFRNHAYYRGIQTGTYGSALNRWIYTPDKNLRVINYVRQMVLRVVKNFEQSKTFLQIRSRTPDHTKMAGSDIGDQLAKAIQEQLFTALFRQREATFCKLSGEYYRHIKWNPEIGPKKKEDVIDTVPITLGAPTWQCLDCISQGVQMGGVMPPEGAPLACPRCGSSNISIQEAQVAQVPVVVGFNYVRMGDLQLSSIDPLEMDIPSHGTDFALANWIRRKYYIPLEDIGYCYPSYDIQGRSEGGDIFLTWQRQLENHPGLSSMALGSSTAEISPYFCLREEIWLRPQMYYKEKAIKDFMLVSGREVTAGQRYIDICPDGMWIDRVNERVVNIAPENKDDHWAMGVNIVNAQSMHGDGIEDIIDAQDITNDLHSMATQHFMRNGSPPTIYDQELCKQGQFITDPGWKIPVKVPLDKRLQDAIFQVPLVPLSPELMPYMEFLQRFMLEGVGADSLEAGAPDLNNQTATAARITTGASKSLNGMTLALKSEVDVKTVSQALRLIQKHWTDSRYLSLTGDLGQLEVKEFKASDIPEDFVVQAVSGSWLPTDTADAQQNFITCLQMKMLNPAQPEVLRYGMQCFNIPLSLIGTDQDEHLGRVKLEKLKLAYKAAMNQYNNPQKAMEFALQAVPIVPHVDEPTVQITIISQWLKTDEGQRIGQAEQAMFLMRIQQLMQMIAALGQEQQQLMMASDPMAAQAAQQQAQGGGAPSGGGAPTPPPGQGGDDSGQGAPPPQG